MGYMGAGSAERHPGRRIGRLLAALGAAILLTLAFAVAVAFVLQAGNPVIALFFAFAIGAGAMYAAPLGLALIVSGWLLCRIEFGED